MDFALSRAMPRSRPAVRSKKARMALTAFACVIAGIAFNIARDGGPPREGTHAEVSLPSFQVLPGVPVAPAPAAGETALVGNTGNSALSLTELEQRLAGVDRDSRDLVLRELLPAIVARQPDEIARHAELEADTQLREQLIRQVAQLWAKSDPDRAMAWVMSLPESPERQATLIDVSLTVAETDAPRAAALREAAVGNIEPDGVLEAIVQRWAERDFDRALAWVDARPRNVQHDKLLQRLVYVLASGGAPGEAARLVEQSFSDGASKAEAASHRQAVLGRSALVLQRLAELHTAIVHADVRIVLPEFDHLGASEQHRAVSMRRQHVHRPIQVEHRDPSRRPCPRTCPSTWPFAFTFDRDGIPSPVTPPARRPAHSASRD
jgi:hypothetical protein